MKSNMTMNTEQVDRYSEIHGKGYTEILGKGITFSPSTFRIRTAFVLWSSKKSAWHLCRCVCLFACSYI